MKGEQNREVWREARAIGGRVDGEEREIVEKQGGEKAAPMGFSSGEKRLDGWCVNQEPECVMEWQNDEKYLLPTLDDTEIQ